jgi:hypothetical protein
MGGLVRDRSSQEIIAIFKKLSRKDLKYLAFHPWELSQRDDLASRIIKDSAANVLHTKDLYHLAQELGISEKDRLELDQMVEKVLRPKRRKKK